MYLKEEMADLKEESVALDAKLGGREFHWGIVLGKKLSFRAVDLQEIVWKDRWWQCLDGLTAGIKSEERTHCVLTTPDIADQASD